MPVTVTIRDESSPGRSTGTFELTGLADRVTLRDLIRTRVREEVALVNADPSRWYRTLVRPLEAEESLNGYRLLKPTWVDWERQADIAEEAFGRNGFFVLVGDRQVDDLDAELDLTADTEVRFLRLTPLVGG